MSLINKDMKNIEVYAWLKDNEEWYYPQKRVDLSQYKHLKLISTCLKYDIFIGWNDDEYETRIFRGDWKETEKEFNQ